MFHRTRSVALAALIFSALPLGGCIIDSPDPETVGTVEGKLSAEGSSQASGETAHEGTTAQLYQLRDDGSAEPVADASAEIEVDGSFRIAVPLDEGVALSDLIVRIESEGETQGQALLHGALSAGSTLTAPPIDAESSAEADVLMQMESASPEDDTDEQDQSFIKLWINAELAASIVSSADYQAAIQATADASASAMIAFDTALGAEAAGTSETQAQSAAKAFVAAQAAIESELYAGAKTADEAAEAQFEALISAYAEAGITAEKLAQAGQAYTEALLRGAAEQSAEAEAQMRAQAHGLRAALVAAAVEAQLTAAGAAEASLTAAAEAEAQLSAEIAASVEAGSGAAMEIAQAWADYSASVEATLPESVSLTAEELTAAKLALEAEADTLRASLEALAETDPAAEGMAVAEAYSAFYLAAEAEVEVLTTLGADEAEASAAISLLAEVVLGQS